MIVIFALALNLAAGSTSATPQTVLSKDGDAIICKTTKVLGSQIPTRVCMTQFEWDDRARAQMEAKRSSQNRGSGCASEGPC